MDNIYIIDKPKNCTSHDVVQKIKRHFKYHKVGHAGTLDPNATGVLIIGYNQGTKLLGSLINNDKEYDADIQFGIQTDTYDITGEVVNRGSFTHINLSLIQATLNYFQNNPYYQTPPLFSAKKINGQKLYQLARNKQTIKNIPSTLVKLIDFKITDFANGILKVKLTVSKGFYIRSLANDLGAALRSCATLVELRRTRSGPFNIANSVPLDKLLNDNKYYE
ncbi:MAG: tRNA pseudouridine(55) synthase TruB [Mycoplasmataceae bacterium]|nr:tRNA pseudouridine(55) synthase TruB [Mycoplasmataceae bacterium]